MPADPGEGLRRGRAGAQDKKRKKASRLERRPGDWDWLLQFREHAPSDPRRWRC
jgi:hypothetical protein